MQTSPTINKHLQLPNAGALQRPAALSTIIIHDRAVFENMPSRTRKPFPVEVE